MARMYMRGARKRVRVPWRRIGRAVRRKPSVLTRAGVLARLAPRAIRYGRIGMGAYGAYRLSRYVRRALPSAKKKGPSLAIWNPSENTENNLQTMTLLEYGITQPQADVEPHARLSQQIFVKGIKVCAYMRNDNPFPVMLHMAVLQYKSEQGSDQTSERKEDFFSIAQDGNAKGLPFPPTAPAAWDIRYNCNGLNSQRFAIITHEKIFLDKYQTGDSLMDSKYMSKRDKYYPIKRRIDFRQDTDVKNQKPFFLMFWWQSVKPSDHLNTNTNVFVQAKTQVYFGNIVS